MTEQQLDALYKQHIPSSHAAALLAVFTAGVSFGKAKAEAEQAEQDEEDLTVFNTLSFSTTLPTTAAPEPTTTAAPEPTTTAAPEVATTAPPVVE